MDNGEGPSRVKRSQYSGKVPALAGTQQQLEGGLVDGCGIQEEGAVVLTGGQRGGEKGVTTYATKNVTRLNAFGETTSLPFLLVARQAHACGKFTNSDGNIVSGSGLFSSFYNECCLNMIQVYIVTGGITNNFERSLQETETLLKDIGTAWKKAANLPTGRCCFSGVGFTNGNFIVAGK